MNIRLIFLDILIDLVSTWLTFLLFFVFWLICFQWTPTSSNYLMSDSTLWQKGSHRLREHPLAKQTPLRGIYSAKVACDLHLAPSTNKSISTSTITSGPWGSIVFGEIWTLEGASMTPHFHGTDQPSLRRQLSEDFCCWCAIGGQQDPWQCIYRHDICYIGKYPCWVYYVPRWHK